MEYKEKFNNILYYLNKCGMSEETATKKALEILESGDCSSLILMVTITLNNIGGYNEFPKPFAKSYDYIS